MLGVSTGREVKPGFWGYRGAVQPHRPSWKEEWAKARQAERGAGARRGCGSDSPCSPPPTWPPPSQPLRGSGAASCGSGRGYRLPRPGQLSSSAPPRLLAQDAMTRFLEERAPGGSRLARIRAGRPTALRLPPLLLLLLLLLGGERNAGGPGGRPARSGRGRGLDYRGQHGTTMRVPTDVRREQL